MLLTTSVGSFPKPDYLIKARSRFRKKEIGQQELRRLEEQSTREWIARQEDLGIDILVDGEQYRGDMATYFAENLEGFAISSLVRSYGNRYYRKPVVIGPIRRKRPITIEWFKFAQGLTKKPVKGMLTGPYTIMDWSFNEHYPNRRAVALAIARVIHDEAKDLERAGATYIQIDEPALSTRTEEIDLAIEAMKICTQGLRAKTITHICYGDFAAIYPKMLKLAVDQIDLEFANRKFELLATFKKPRFTKEVGLGVVDVHSHRTESKEEVIGNIEQALKVFKPEQIYVDPDCGLKTRTVDEAVDKLRVIVEAAREVRSRLGTKHSVHSTSLSTDPERAKRVEGSALSTKARRLVNSR
ncbi:MAG: methionine synthase [Candidatus Omnitrophica bacterium]|nr:methionine synthase [Candidatus Omnitrophota bacterium]